MKIKVIDLLIKIANGEEVPKVIKYDETRYLFRSYDYKEIDINGDYIYENSSFIEQIDFYKLNNEVEIIEEPKKIEKWGQVALEEMENCTDYKIEDLQKYIRVLAETQNELIDEINNLKEK